MAASSTLTSLEDFEAGPTYNDIGSGGGATDDTNAPIEGATAGGRRADSATDKGFMATISSTDLSGANEHVKMWVNVFQWGSVTALHARIRSGTNTYDNHDYPVADIPISYGYIPIWVDVSRTPDSVGSTSGANEAAITDIGFYLSIGNVQGAGNNTFLDEIHHGTSGLQFTGASGNFAAFRTYESTNVEGNLLTLYNGDLCFSRLELSDTASTQFTDSGFTITFPDQALVSSTFMGITADLTHASTAVTLSNGAFVSGNPSGATNRFDILATGTLNGVFDMSVMLINGARTIELNEQCSLTDSTVVNTGVVDCTAAGTTNGADVSGTSFVDSTVATDTSQLLWDVNADPDGELDGCSFDRGSNLHHAIELGTSSPLTMTFRNLTSVGFHASDEQTSSFFHVLRTSGTVTINVLNSTGNFSYKSAGADVNVVIDPVLTTIHVQDNNANDLQNARVLVEAGDATGDLVFEESVTITHTTTTAEVSHTTHGIADGTKVSIRGANEQPYNGVFVISVTDANNYTYTMGSDPGADATGTITATGVVLHGLTDVNGDISGPLTSYSVDQNVRGVVRKSSASPFFKLFDFTDVIDNVNGLTKTVQMIIDE